jgi:hypothetical protein
MTYVRNMFILLTSVLIAQSHINSYIFPTYHLLHSQKMATNSSETSEKQENAEVDADISRDVVKECPTFPRFTRLSPDVQGPQLELPERDLLIAGATWNNYILPAQDFSYVLFKELFQAYPDYEDMFRNLMKITDQDIFANPQFHSHMNTRLVNMLKEIMENLNKPEELNSIMNRLGLYENTKMRGTPEEMETMRRPVINAVRTVMSNMNRQMEKDEEEALNKCLTYALHIALNAAGKYLESDGEI